MGLLDSLTSQGGYGGLLDALMYQSPLYQKPEYSPYANLNMGLDPSSPVATNPFGPAPQMPQAQPLSKWDAPQSAPPPAAMMPGPASNIMGAMPGMLAPAPTQPLNPYEQQMMALVRPGANPPAAATTQSAALGPQPTPPVDQVNDINVGGYQMPRFGGTADFTPQAPQGLPTDVSAQSRQSQAPQQPPQALPPAFGSGSALGRIGNPDGLIARLTGNDSRSVAQKNLKAQYDALVPLVGQQKAMLAVMNPEAGKTILAQALEKKQYGFTKLDNDTIVNQDPQTGKVSVAYSADKGSSIQGPDGKMIEMPQGADPKTWRNEITRINADVAAGKKTEVQAKAEIFANKMEQSNKSIADGVGTSLAGKIASGLPLGNYVQSPEYQKYKQASSNFITALLRQESGAAISKSEFDRYDKEYMPQPGDSAAVLAQKTEARRVAIDGMKKGAGPGYKGPATGGIRKYNPATGTIE